MKFFNLCAFVGFGLLSLSLTQSARAEWVSNYTVIDSAIGAGGKLTNTGLDCTATETLASQYPNRLKGYTFANNEVRITWNGPIPNLYPAYAGWFSSTHLDGSVGAGDYNKAGGPNVGQKPYLEYINGGHDFTGTFAEYNSPMTFGYTVMADVEVYTGSTATAHSTLAFSQ